MKNRDYLQERKLNYVDWYVGKYTQIEKENKILLEKIANVMNSNTNKASMQSKYLIV